MIKRIFTAFLAAALAATGALSHPARAAGTPSSPAYAGQEAAAVASPARTVDQLDGDALRCGYAYAICMDTGDVILDKNSTERVAMASLTKIMTALLTVENCSDLDGEIVVSAEAIAATPEISSTAGLIVGERMTVRDMLYCLLLPSGNDAANVLAEYCGGSIDAFVEMMNRRAQELGLRDTQFRNPHGLDAEGHYTTAADLAKLLSFALQNEQFKKVFSSFSYVVPATNLSGERALRSTNRMTDQTADVYVPGITGTKTGFTGNAGYCLACTSRVDDGPAVLSVVLGGGYPDGAACPDSYADSKYIIETAAQKYRVVRLQTAGDDLGEVPVECLKGADTIGVAAKEDLFALVDRGEEDAVTASVTPALLTPPFEQDAAAGTVVYTDADGEVLAQGAAVTVSAGEYSRWKGFAKALEEMSLLQYIGILLGFAVVLFLIFLLIQALRRHMKRRRRMRARKRASAARRRSR